MRQLRAVAKLLLIRQCANFLAVFLHLHSLETRCGTVYIPVAMLQWTLKNARPNALQSWLTSAEVNAYTNWGKSLHLLE